MHLHSCQNPVPVLLYVRPKRLAMGTCSAVMTMHRVADLRPSIGQWAVETNHACSGNWWALLGRGWAWQIKQPCFNGIQRENFITGRWSGLLGGTGACGGL